MALNEMFTTVTTNQTQSTRNLGGTAQLTMIANDLANTAIAAIEANYDEYSNLFEDSKYTHSAMDELVDTLVDFTSVDVDFLSAASDEELDKMLKSQQSKRSRLKAKVMTLDNYKSYMTGAIAERILRSVSGKDKSSGAGRRATALVEFTTEDLELLAQDQERLRREIRNIQSKKSIMKSKVGFTESDIRWQALLVAEEQLKGIRVGTSPKPTVVYVDNTKDAVSEMLGSVDINSLKAADARDLLEKMQGLIAGNKSQEDAE